MKHAFVVVGASDATPSEQVVYLVERSRARHNCGKLLKERQQLADQVPDEQELSACQKHYNYQWKKLNKQHDFTWGMLEFSLIHQGH